MIVTPAEVCKIRIQSQYHSMMDPAQLINAKYRNAPQTVRSLPALLTVTLFTHCSQTTLIILAHALCMLCVLAATLSPRVNLNDVELSITLIVFAKS